MTKERKFIGNIGDVDWLQHGGTLIFQDEDYSCEAVNIDPYRTHTGEAEDEYDPCMKWEIHSFSLERMLILGDNSLVDAHYGSVAWFSDKIEDIASCVGRKPEELRDAFTSHDPFVLSNAYSDVGSYYGYNNLDTYPEYLDRAEMKERFETITGEEIDLREEDDSKLGV